MAAAVQAREGVNLLQRFASSAGGGPGGSVGGMNPSAAADHHHQQQQQQQQQRNRLQDMLVYEQRAAMEQQQRALEERAIFAELEQRQAMYGAAAAAMHRGGAGPTSMDAFYSGLYRPRSESPYVKDYLSANGSSMGGVGGTVGGVGLPPPLVRNIGMPPHSGSSSSLVNNTSYKHRFAPESFSSGGVNVSGNAHSTTQLNLQLR